MNLSNIEINNSSDETYENNYDTHKLKLPNKEDSLWTNKYDSVFLVNPDGSPIIILKNYEQQYPLSYHYINNMNKII